MPRGANICRVDKNQQELVTLWRKMGVSVWITSQVGSGPDVILGVKDALGARHNLLVEIKDGRKPPSGRQLTPAEAQFHETWQGQICVIKNAQEAIDLIQTTREGYAVKSVL